MSEPFLGEIRMFAGDFAPVHWAFCDNAMLSVGQNQALFSLLGTTYGGDGRSTFALPDLRGRVPVHQGQGPGLSQQPPGCTYGHRNRDSYSQHNAQPSAPHAGVTQRGEHG